MKIRPSNLHRAISCPGSLHLCRGVTDTSGCGGYAEQGRFQHALAAFMLEALPDTFNFYPLGGTVWIHSDRAALLNPPEVPDGPGWSAFRVTPDALGAIATYVSQVRKAAENAILFVEQSVPVHACCGPDGAQTGTPDAVILREGEIEIWDRKLPFGSPVSPVENPQLIAYAMGVLDDIYPQQYPLDDVEIVRLAVSQGAKEPSVWEVTPEALRGHAARIRAAVDASASPDAPLRPSESACAYCPAKAVCPALKAIVDECARSAGEELAAVEALAAGNPGAARPGDLAAQLRRLPLLKLWMKAVEAAAYAEAIAGRVPEGFTLAPGKPGARKWADEAAVEEILLKWRWPRTAIYSEKLRTAPDLLKTAPAALLESAVRGERTPDGAAATKRRVLERYICRGIGAPRLIPAGGGPSVDVEGLEI